MYLEDGADVVVVGSKGGTDTHPAWFHNLMAMAETEAELGGERRRVRPKLADAEERARLWPRLVELYPPYEEYQELHEPGDSGRLAQARRLADRTLAADPYRPGECLSRKATLHVLGHDLHRPPGSSLGLNSTTSVPVYRMGVCPAPT
jgi:deazaflavin-dependent oxidoreductase (nitroreductase family)